MSRACRGTGKPSLTEEGVGKLGLPAALLVDELDSKRLVPFIGIIKESETSWPMQKPMLASFYATGTKITYPPTYGSKAG